MNSGVAPWSSPCRRRRRARAAAALRRRARSRSPGTAPSYHHSRTPRPRRRRPPHPPHHAHLRPLAAAFRSPLLLRPPPPPPRPQSRHTAAPHRQPGTPCRPRASCAARPPRAARSAPRRAAAPARPRTVGRSQPPHRVRRVLGPPLGRHAVRPRRAVRRDGRPAAALPSSSPYVTPGSCTTVSMIDVDEPLRPLLLAQPVRALELGRAATPPRARRRRPPCAPPGTRTGCGRRPR